MATDPASMDRVSRIRRILEENKQDPELFSPHLVSHSPWDAVFKHHHKGAAEEFFKPESALDSLKISVEEAVEDGDKVVVRFRVQGKWTKPFAGIEPTQREIDVTGINIYRFVGDKIVEKHGEIDWATFGKQAFGGLSAEACQRALQAVSLPATRAS